MSRWKVLSTKTLDADVRTLLEENGIDITEKDLISIAPVITSTAIEQIKAVNGKTVVFTSSNAVNAVKDHLADVAMNVFCMAGKTKKAVQETLKNVTIVATADSAKGIAEEIIRSGTEKVIFFCGDIRRDELPGLLQENNVAVEEVVVYTTRETQVRIHEQFDGIIFFSPSAVRSFFSVNELTNTTVVFSIGETTADEITKYTTNKIIVADTPLQEALAAMITEHFKQA